MSTRVLVVDDNSLVRECLRFMLSLAGMEVVEISTCCKARQMAAAGLREGQFPLRAWICVRLKKQWKPSGEMEMSPPRNNQFLRRFAW